MINDVMIFLKDHLSAHLPDSSSAVPKVVFAQRSGAAETIGFSAETIVPLLINVEEDKAWQTPDRYSRLGADGRREKIHPDLCLGLSVLFVAHFSVYETALEYLSLTVRHFQQFRAFESGGSLPALPAGIASLKVEMTSLPLPQLNDVWRLLGTAYHPSVLYKVKLVVLSDEAAEAIEAVKDITIRPPRSLNDPAVPSAKSHKPGTVTLVPAGSYQGQSAKLDEMARNPRNPALDEVATKLPPEGPPKPSR